jgi:tRNA-dihydrouridine synthase A
MPRSTFAIAPMMGWSDVAFRRWMRCLFEGIDVYTEMVTVNAICYGNADQLLAEDDHASIVLQVGGSDPSMCQEAAHMAYEKGYRHIDLNIGCPSDRVQKGMIGAVLMKYPETVARCFQALCVQPDMSVSVKSRIGVDEQDDEAFLVAFLDEVTGAGCQNLTIHARKAWLNGMSPKDNRNIPPLNYERVYAMKVRYPDVFMMINGGLRDAQQVSEALNHVDGVMFGRLAIERQRDLIQIASDNQFLKSTVREALTNYQSYLMEYPLKNYLSLKPLMALLHDFKGAKQLRSEMALLMRKSEPVNDFIDRLKSQFPD